MSTLPPIPPVPDADRYWSGTIGAATASVGVPFPVYGDGTDLDVVFNGTPVPTGNWSFVSAGNPGVPLTSLPLPIVDGQIFFYPAQPNGFLEIIGDCHPRQLAQPTAPGIGRREFNQTTSSILSTVRELWRAIKQQRAAGLTYNAAGPLAQRGNFDGAVPPFIYLQTDDAQGRTVLYAKQSGAAGDWSGPLPITGPAGTPGAAGTNGTNGTNGAYAPTDPVAAAVLATDYLPILSAGLPKRVLRNTLLSGLASNLFVTALWTGDGQSSGQVSAPLVIMGDGTPRSWGQSMDGGNGDPSAGANRWLPKTMQFDPANAIAPTLPFTQCARAGSSAFLLDSAGLVYALGGNAVGQLGVGDTTLRRRFTLITTFQTAGIQIAEIVTQPGVYSPSAGSTVYFRTTTGLLYATGANTAGQIGDGTTVNRSVPTRCGTLTNVAKVVTAVDYSLQNFVMALDTSGNLYAWGYNPYGNIGDGSTTSRSAPFLTLTGVADMALSMAVNTAASATGGHAVAVKTDGTVRTLGFNGYGQLGQGDTTNRNAWTLVVGITTAAKAFAGGGYYGFSGVVLANGTVQLWGANNHSNLGTGASANQLTPYTPAGAFQGKVSLVHNAGWFNASIIGLFCTDGSVWAAGYNASGAAGQADNFVDVASFSRVVLPVGVTALPIAIKFIGSSSSGSTSDLSLFVLLADGTLWATGSNTIGQLGTQSANLHYVDALEKVIFT